MDSIYKSAATRVAEDPRISGPYATGSEPGTVFGELTSRSRGQNQLLEAYVSGLESLVGRLTGNAAQNGHGDAPKPAFAAIGELGDTFEDRVRLLDRLESACSTLESLA